MTAPILNAGRLFVVATPLGHLDDVTLRALRVLGEAAVIACEDTRRTARLLARHEITTPLVCYREHNEAAQSARLVARLQTGDDIALVSDAGTPGISDPGARLCREARAAGFAVIPIPGPSAVVTALSVSGLPAERFHFAGFLPARAQRRRAALEALADIRETLVFYEAPHRIGATVAALLEVLGDRPAFWCREATKRHEDYRAGRLSELRDWARVAAHARGEFTLVVAGAAERAAPELDVRAAYEELAGAGWTRRAAVREVARRSGLSAREVYNRTLDRD